MGEQKLSRAKLAGHQRDRVISMASPVFAERGYPTTTVDDLLAAGKVGVGNFYSLFKGKEDCFLACLDRVLIDAQGRIDAAIADAPDWDHAAYAGLAAALELLSQDSPGGRLLLVESQCAGAEASARYDAVIDRAVGWLASGRAAHPEAERLPPSFEQASISGLAFYLQRCLVEGQLPSSEDLLAETAGLLLGPVIGTERLTSLSREQSAALIG
jgi:AcrR family transcriptional regulator